MAPQLGGPTPAKTVHRSRPITRQLPAPITRPANPSPSPKGWKKLETDRRVGLAIVAALERTSGETPPPSMIVSAAAAAAAAAAAVASSPISIASPRPASERACPEASESWLSGGGGGLLIEQETAAVVEELGRFQVADFLSFCHLCRRRLHGKDIYMYRGEKAFCSIECRCQQIISDEYQEICGAEAPRPAAEASSSPYSGGSRIFFPSIVVS